MGEAKRRKEFLQRMSEEVWHSHGTDGDQCTWCKKPLGTRSQVFVGKDKRGVQHEVGACCLDKLKWVEGVGIHLNAEDAVKWVLPDEVKSN
jgi:hypothetical protein